eukprot:TRINITY_DN79991_c0_g1_i1.p1 TRINITY_DN79991_c0_g1~~TRINITY_DN79991_c0_g1_i1.p1  ORF type:complete len:591 (+),score=149.03 TRINITY_DN79991_c0_g1_i1:58-1773(+)
MAVCQPAHGTGALRQSSRPVALLPGEALSPSQYVSAEHATSKLWRVTSEYEGVMELQRRHHSLLARQRQLSVSLAGRAGHRRQTSSESIPDSQDEAEDGQRYSNEYLAATLEAKQQELKLLDAIVKLRDWQIEDLEEMCRARRADCGRLAAAEMAAVGGAGALSDQEVELQQLLAKEKELEAAVAASRAALHDAAREKLDADDKKASDTGAASLSEQVDKMRRRLAGAEQAMGRLAQSSVEKERLVKCFVDGLSARIPPTPSEASCMMKRQEESVLGGLSALKVEHHMSSIVDAETTEELLDEAEAEDNCYQTPPVKRLDLTATILDPPADSALLAAAALPAALKPPPSWTGQGAHSLSQFETGDYSSTLTAAAPAVSASRRPYDEAEGRQQQQQQPFSPWLLSADLSSEAVAEQTMHRNWESSDPLSNRSVGTYLAERSSLAEIVENQLGDGGSPRGQSTYRPQPGDAVDWKVAEFVNKPRNRLRRSLFCRLGPGAYLYGTHRAHLRLSAATGELEACDDAGGPWEAVEEFARRLERLQSGRLLRARARASRGGEAASAAVPPDSSLALA